VQLQCITGSMLCVCVCVCVCVCENMCVRQARKRLSGCDEVAWIQGPEGDARRIQGAPVGWLHGAAHSAWPVCVCVRACADAPPSQWPPCTTRSHFPHTRTTHTHTHTQTDTNSHTHTHTHTHTDTHTHTHRPRTVRCPVEPPDRCALDTPCVALRPLNPCNFITP